MILATVTGHREVENKQFVSTQIGLALKDFNVDCLFQGMAKGVDQLAASVAFKNRVAYVAVRPWAGHKVGPHYDLVLQHATKVVVLDDAIKYPGPWVYMKRNEYMVDRSNFLIAVWDGKTSGGTYSCVKYALKKERPVWRIDPKSCTVGWYVL